MSIVRFLILFTLACVGFARAAVTPTAPILRIETGMHTALLHRIATDAANQYLATTSNDKTVRVWNLAGGELLNTLRPPIDEGNEGKLYAVAMSPDGNTIAAGGWTGYAWDKSNSIYVFDRASGKIIHRIAGLPEVVLSLTWSPDGRYLAAGLGLQHGIRIYRADSFSLLGMDRAYGGNASGADFDRNGRLATSSWDGQVRLYQVTDSGVKLVSRQQAPGGKRPHAIRFSPDGALLVAGYEDTMAVSVLDAASLKLKFSPDTGGVNGNLSSVAWSADGTTLYAGGTYERQGASLVRRWDKGGQGQPSDTPSSGNTLLDLVPLRAGGVAFAGADPAFGVVDNAGNRSMFIHHVKADFRENLDGFKLSPAADRVSFGFGFGGKQPFSIDVRSRGFSAGVLPQVHGPVTQTPAFEVGDWKHETAPKLNGQLLALAANEVTRSLAVAPDAEVFALGSDWSLRLYGKEGKLRWLVPSPGVTRVVNIPSNARVVVAGYGDGTIRWHRLSDGKEVLAFFPHKDQKRWVLWTPSGYYDAAAGAEDLIGWHLNRGKEQAADFYPASRFRSQFHRPDVIDRALDTLDENQAVRLADEAAGRKTQVADIKTILPPVVEILSPRDGVHVNQNQVKVRFNARSDAPVTAIRVRVNGQNIPEIQGLTAGGKRDGTQEVTIPIPPEDSEIMVFAESQHGVSTPGKLRVKWGEAAPAGATPAVASTVKASTAKGEFQIKPKLYILAIGVSEFRKKSLNLDYAAKDAGDFVAALRRQHGKLYRDVEVKLLADKSATKDDVLDGLDWLRKQVTAKDIGMLFIAGHGTHDSDGTYYFLAHDTDDEKLRRTGVSQNEIKTVLANLAGKAILFIDTCHSGSVVSGRRAVGSSVNGFLNELTSAENGVLVFAASTGKQFSMEHPDWGNGAFTKALVEGINGKADLQQTGRITHKALDYYIAERVKELTKGEQSPVTITPPYGVPDYPIAVTK